MIPLRNVLKKRSLRPEGMDDPGLEVDLHYQALQGLQRINILSGVTRQIFKGLSVFLKEKGGRIKILDIAAGGGDIPIALAQKAKQYFLPVEIHACDKSETAVAYAQLKSRQKNVPVKFFKLDIFTDEIPGGYHIIISSLFLHHLPILQTFGFLKKISKAAQLGILLNDLQRCWPGFILASSIPSFLTSSRIVRQDGIRSVRAAYSLAEIKRIVERAGLEGAQIKKAWPFRYQLIWRKNV